MSRVRAQSPVTFLSLFSRIDTVFGTEGLKISRVTLQELTVTMMSAVIIGKHNLAVISTGQISTHTHKHTCTVAHTLVGG